MGTDDPWHPDDGEGPEHRVSLSTYEMGRFTVTNLDFNAFVEATGHTTTAEVLGSSFVFAGLLPDDFLPTRAVAAAPWWREVPGASWRHPEGPQSTIDTRGTHPVVHVSWFDAVAYCAWTGTRLPTEAEWERAARGLQTGAHFPWGHEREPGGERRMNVFVGEFPVHDPTDPGWQGTTPVGSYPGNDFGMHDVVGNVWEWCSDWFDTEYYKHSPLHEPRGPEKGETKVMRGGSYLCHESYCRRFRVDSRTSNTPDSSAGNLGFRVAR